MGGVSLLGMSLGDVAEPAFEAGRHIYTRGGRTLPSVSALLSPLTAEAYGSIDPETLAAKAAFGTAVHACTEYDDLGLLDEATVEPEWAPRLAAYRKWRREMAPDVRAIELRLCCDAFAGTLDRIVRMQGALWVVDIKTTSTIHPHVGIQLAAYEILARAHLNEPAPLKRGALQVNADGGYKFREFRSLHDYRALAALISLYSWKQMNH
jgi:hypothetical protein